VQSIAMLRARGAHVLAIAFDRGSFLTGVAAAAETASTWSGLLDLGVNYLTIRNGDELVKVFNP
jgi:hypothetical protein